MDTTTLPLDLIVYGAIALGLVLWLRNVLGTRHGQERKRPNPFANPPPPTPRSPLGQQAPHGTHARAAGASEGDDDLMDIPAANRTLAERVTHKGAILAPAAIRGLETIEAADAKFDINHFLGGAEAAFDMIVRAFAEGDRDTLKALLGKNLYADFDKALIDRELRGETLATDIIAIRSITVTDAGLIGPVARVTLRFDAEETKVTRNRDGVVVQGDPDRHVSAIDVWVFEHDVKSKDPTWRVIETLEGDV